MNDAATYFETLFGDVDSGYLSISVKPVGKKWQDDFKIIDLSKPDEIPAVTERLAKSKPTADVYATVCPRLTPARGRQGNTKWVTALWLELDSPESSNGKKDQADRYFVDLDDARRFVENSAPWRPAMIVNSGHGWHFYWRLTESVTEDHDELLAAWRGFWEGKAAAAGKSLDPVFDSARVMRVPGTWNMKSKPVEVTVVEVDAQARYDTSDILDSIPTELRRQASTYASALADDAAVQAWLDARSNGWTDRGHRYVDGLVDEMRSAPERHPAAKRFLASLLQNRRAGVDYLEAVDMLRSVFKRRVAGERRGLEFDELVTWIVSQRIAEGNEDDGDADNPRGLLLVPASTITLDRQQDGSASPTPRAGLLLPDGLRLYRPGDLGGYIEPPSNDVLCGPIGEWLAAIEPETETSQAALGAGTLAALGAWLGRQVNMRVGRITHRTNLFAVVVGPSSYSRKGTASGEIRHLVRSIDPSFADENYASGFGSGEAIIDRIRDAELDKDGNVIRGVTDQRLFVEEGEYARVLRVASRQGSILSDVLRLAYDGGRRLENITKGSKITSTNHHVSLFGAITPEELTTLFTAVAAVNGAGNRNLWVWSNERKLLPEGGAPVDIDHIVRTIQWSRTDRRISYERTPEAVDWWNAQYGELRNLEHVPASVRPIVTRSTDHVQRIGLIYAATEGVERVDVRHLEAGLAWTEHSTSTVISVLGELVADELAGRILGSLRQHPGVSVTRSEIHDLLGRNFTAAAVTASIESLAAAGLVYQWRGESGGGRPPEMVVATTRTEKT